MQPALALAVLLALFGVTHIGLASHRVREPMEQRLGAWRFSLLFSLIAALSFSALVTYYARHRFEGVAGPGIWLLHGDLGSDPVGSDATATGQPGQWFPILVSLARWSLMTIVGAGVVLIVCGLASYPRSAHALFQHETPAPYGIARITRHPFLVGLALFALAHALLATRLVGTVFAIGLGAVALLGARHQDAKLLARRGAPYASYLQATSTIPFAAIRQGRQRVVWKELSAGIVATGIALSLALRAVHGDIFSHGGILVIGAVLGGAFLETVGAWQRVRSRAKATRGAHRRPLDVLPARLIFATAIGHVLVGVTLFHEPLAAIWQDGVLNSVGGLPGGFVGSSIGSFNGGSPRLGVPALERLLAFWFVLFGPALWMIGQIVQRAVARPDPRVLRVVGWDLLAIGALGAAIMPISGFWILMAIAPVVLKVAWRLDTGTADG